MVNKPEDTFAASPQQKTHPEKILIITADETQDLEFFYPYYRFTEAGYQVDVATPDGGEFKGKQGMGLKKTLSLREVDDTQYQLLYIPGGKAPEKLKKNDVAITLTQNFVESGKPVAAICHGAQLLAAANVIKGRNIAAWPEVEGEVKAAGGNFVNEATVVDGQFITGRWPGDLPLHLAHTLKVLEGKQSSKTLPLRAANA